MLKRKEIKKMNEVNAVEIVRPTFDNEIIVKIPKNIPKIEHNLGQLKDFAIKLKDFYSHLVFTDDSISEAQEEKTRLNKLINEVKRQRIDNITEYKKPIEDFEKTAKEIETLLNDAKSCVQVFIDNAENTRKTEKREKVILPIINECINNAFIKDNVLIDINKIEEDKRWYNKTISNNEIKANVEMQINDLVKQEKDYQEGLEVIKINLDVSEMSDDYNKYAERFKYTRDLTGILQDIKAERERKDFNKEEVINTLDTLKMFDADINDIKADNIDLQNEVVEFTLKIKGTIDQFTNLRKYAKEIGMEVVENGFY